MNMKKLISIICGSFIFGTTFLFCGCGSESMANQKDSIENSVSERVYSHDELLAVIKDYSDVQSEMEPLFYDFNGDGKEEVICEFGRTITEDGNDFYQQYFIYTDGVHTFEFGDLTESVYYSSEYNLIPVDKGCHFAVTTGWRGAVLGGYYSSSAIYELTSEGAKECFTKWFCGLKEPGNSSIKVDYYEEAVAGGEVVRSDVLYWNGKEYLPYK